MDRLTANHFFAGQLFIMAIIQHSTRRSFQPSSHPGRSLQWIVFLSCFAALAGCGGMCGNEISQTARSPSGDLKAVVFNRNCGTTTGFNTQVSIIAATESLQNVAGNTLILDGSVPLQAQWLSDSALHLSGLGSAEVFKQDDSVAGVSLSYGN